MSAVKLTSALSILKVQLEVIFFSSFGAEKYVLTAFYPFLILSLAFSFKSTHSRQTSALNLYLFVLFFTIKFFGSVGFFVLLCDCLQPPRTTLFGGPGST